MSCDLPPLSVLYGPAQHRLWTGCFVRLIHYLSAVLSLGRQAGPRVAQPWHSTIGLCVRHSSVACALPETDTSAPAARSWTPRFLRRGAVLTLHVAPADTDDRPGFSFESSGRNSMPTTSKMRTNACHQLAHSRSTPQGLQLCKLADVVLVGAVGGVVRAVEQSDI